MSPNGEQSSLGCCAIRRHARYRADSNFGKPHRFRPKPQLGGTDRCIRDPSGLFSFNRGCPPQLTGGFLSLPQRRTRPGQLPSGIDYYGSVQPR